MILREFSINDYEAIVDMYYEFISEVFEDRTISSKYFFYRIVQGWINSKKDIIVAVDGDTIAGFTMSYIDTFNGLTSPIYNCEVAYTRKAFRNTKASYMLFHNIHNYAKQNNLNTTVNCRIENNLDKSIEKHFNLKPKFTTLEG